VKNSLLTVSSLLPLPVLSCFALACSLSHLPNPCSAYRADRPLLRPHWRSAGATRQAANRPADVGDEGARHHACRDRQISHGPPRQGAQRDRGPAAPGNVRPLQGHKRQTTDCSRELTDSATATITHFSARGVRSAFSALWYDWLLRGCKWTFSPFNSGVITTYTLKIGAAGEGDNRDHTFSAFQAVRRSIHSILPILPQTRKPERLFHWYISRHRQFIECPLCAKSGRSLKVGF
jgi:hypothetical protein